MSIVPLPLVSQCSRQLADEKYSEALSVLWTAVYENTLAIFLLPHLS